VIMTLSLIGTISIFNIYLFNLQDCKGDIVYGVVDRIEEGCVVLLLIDDTELIATASSMPNGITEGSWLKLKRKANSFCSVTSDIEMTKQYENKIKKLYDEIKSSPSLQRVKNRDENE